MLAVVVMAALAYGVLRDPPQKLYEPFMVYAPSKPETHVDPSGIDACVIALVIREFIKLLDKLPANPKPSVDAIFDNAHGGIEQAVHLAFAAMSPATVEEVKAAARKYSNVVAAFIKANHCSGPSSVTNAPRLATELKAMHNSFM